MSKGTSSLSNRNLKLKLLKWTVDFTYRMYQLSPEKNFVRNKYFTNKQRRHNLIVIYKYVYSVWLWDFLNQSNSQCLILATVYAWANKMLNGASFQRAMFYIETDKINHGAWSEMSKYVCWLKGTQPAGSLICIIKSPQNQPTKVSSTTFGAWKLYTLLRKKVNAELFYMTTLKVCSFYSYVYCLLIYMYIVFWVLRVPIDYQGMNSIKVWTVWKFLGRGCSLYVVKLPTEPEEPPNRVGYIIWLWLQASSLGIGLPTPSQTGDALCNIGDTRCITVYSWSLGRFWKTWKKVGLESSFSFSFGISFNFGEHSSVPPLQDACSQIWSWSTPFNKF